MLLLDHSPSLRSRAPGSINDSLRFHPRRHGAATLCIRVILCFIRTFNAASSVAWQQGLSSKITREQQIPCWASLGFFPGCRGLEASLGRRQRRITYASIHTFAVWQFCFHIITLLIFQASSHSSISSVKSSSIKEDLCFPYLNVTCHGVSAEAPSGSPLFSL